MSAREKTSTALFFKYNTQLGPPYQVLVDTNFINFSIKNKARPGAPWTPIGPALQRRCNCAAGTLCVFDMRASTAISCRETVASQVTTFGGSSEPKAS